MVDWIKVIFKPKSILALLVVAGIVFLFIGGMSIPFQKEVSAFFLTTGTILLVIGLIGWLFFIVPAIVRNLKH